MDCLTKALPASGVQVYLSPSKCATAHPGHSSITDRSKGSVASVSIAMSSLELCGAMLGGSRTALAASARLAKTPSLLGAMVKSRRNDKRKIDREREMDREGKKGRCTPATSLVESKEEKAVFEVDKLALSLRK